MKTKLLPTDAAMAERKDHKSFYAIRRVCLILLLWCAICPDASSQPLNLDSLWSSWHNKSLPDTVRLNALLAFCTNGQNLHADTALMHAQMGYQFAEKKNLADFRMEFLYKMATSRSKAGELDAAETFGRRSVTLADSLHDKEHHVKCLILLGNIYNTRSDYAAAIDAYLKASNMAENLNYQLLYIYSIYNIGNAYMGLEEYDKALYYFQKHLKLAETNRDTHRISNGLTSLGMIHLAINNLPEALKFYTLGLQMAKTAGITGSYGVSYMNIGDVYALMNEPTLAISNYKSAMKEYLAKSNKIGQAQTLYRIAKLYKTQFPDSTLILGQRALEMARAADKKICYLTSLCSCTKPTKPGGSTNVRLVCISCIAKPRIRSTVKNNCNPSPEAKPNINTKKRNSRIASPLKSNSPKPGSPVNAGSFCCLALLYSSLPEACSTFTTATSNTRLNDPKHCSKSAIYVKTWLNKPYIAPEYKETLSLAKKK